MNEEERKRKYDLEERTWRFARNVREFVRKFHKTIDVLNDLGQVARSSGSVSNNYIEANEALSKKDFRMRIKICRKESKESNSVLRLLEVAAKPKLVDECNRLADEADQLMRIFASILHKSGP